MSVHSFLKRVFLLFLLLLIVPGSGRFLCRAAEPPDLPFDLPASQILPLHKTLDRTLQAGLNHELHRNRHWSALVKRKKLAVGLVDLTDPRHVRFAVVNGDEMMFAASLPKLGILLAGCEALEQGTLKESPEILQDMHVMISQSDNGAASRMIDRLGSRNIESVLTDPKYRLFDAGRGGGIWVGGGYVKGSDYFPDPLKGLSHAATAFQVCRFYYLLAYGQLVDPTHSRQMLDMLVNSELHDKFIFSLDSLAQTAQIYRKSGTYRKWHSDSVLVWGPDWRRYILTALVEDPRGELICREMVFAAERALKVRPRARTQTAAASHARASGNTARGAGSR